MSARQLPNFVGEFELMNPDKVERAMYGTTTSAGALQGGVAGETYFEEGRYMKAGEQLSEKEVAELEVELLVEYDRIGGFIKKGDDKVASGSFYDFKARRARVEPEVVLEFRVDGKLVNVPANEELPNKVRAQKLLAAEEAEEDGGEKPKRGRKTRQIV